MPPPGGGDGVGGGVVGGGVVGGGVVGGGVAGGGVVGGGGVGGGVVGGGVVGGGVDAVTTSVRSSVTSGLTPFLAVSVTLYVPAASGSGVPLITPVVESSFRPSGSVPWIRLTVGGGVPVRTGV